jgi:diaminopimelate decarboxylase
VPSPMAQGLADIETPAYVYDLAEVRRAYGRLREALPAPSDLYYSLKANPHPAVTATLREFGCRAEVCSPGELHAALDAGFSATDMLYTGPGKRNADVLEALKAGVTEFSVDSPHGLDQVDAAAAVQGVRARCLLRVNDGSPTPGQGLTMTGVASQFGADVDWILAEPDRFAARPSAAVAGYHLYTGSNIPDEDALLSQFTQAAQTARRLAEASGVTLEVLDLGGGFGAPFARAGTTPAFPTLATRVALVLDAEFPGWRDGRPRVAFESGRYLTGTCGTLLTRVLDVKHSHGRDVLVLESGINHLGGMSGLRRLPPIVPHLCPAEDRAGAGCDDAIVTGPLCTPLDTWARNARVGPVRPGDLLAVPNVGAYGLYASLLAFLGHPAPVEVVIDGGRITDLSRLALRRHPVPDPTRT